MKIYKCIFFNLIYLFLKTYIDSKLSLKVNRLFNHVIFLLCLSLYSKLYRIAEFMTLV